jgi:hypothetical protein
VDKALDPFKEEIEWLATSNEYSSIDGGQEICQIPNNEKHNSTFVFTAE